MTSMSRFARSPATTVAAALVYFAANAFTAAPVRADQIDGNWCRGLKHLFIDGPTIITPGGTKITGTYDRHGFRYIVPTGEPDTRATISMTQIDDDLMQMTSSGNPDERQDWARCERKIS